ncbi:MAG: 3-isopropylmalate dehydrogenase, partial [Armatimonadetes bacterium]|nr:3-isopropylmalate dehydrogenase [Armatimonadota bacterium]
MAAHTIAVLPGDGIGPEVTAEALKVLRAVARRFGHTFQFRDALVGGAAIDAAGIPLPSQTLETCRASDAILLGAVGGATWDALPLQQRPERGILALRQALGVFANLRPAVAYAPLLSASPLRADVIIGTDVLIVRELTGGLYFGRPRGQETVDGRRRAVDTLPYAEDEVARVARVALEAARRRRRRVTSVDKANVLETSRLWRQVVVEVAGEYPDVMLNHMY